MSDALLLAAALLLVVTAVVHSVVGERRLISPVLARHDGILKSPLARFVLRFAWHITSVAWIVIALILAVLVLDPTAVRWWAAVGTGAIFTAIGAFTALSSRGRHIGWPFLTGIGLTALASLLA
ncbi:hypothetical protein FFK22_017230 [Mycobacterium sp. KBS0706]|uniref:hypothetical protein n=1 Tax=Mycobacterium sp. KBS0706 TaxID=2578109 RepID=UPI00110F92B2|nr:hypothetical protein [Mycobacterium sp. KBS0706]TSD87415.1 hypothetical protein FFK22_017230 [Mycobacterium sp. KBS0706]